MRDPLTEEIIGAAMAVHRTLGPGFLESVYQKALLHELGKRNISALLEAPIQIRYDGIIVGNFNADLLVAQRVILELKAVERIAKAHEVQLVNYLTATGLDIGLLVNFGGPSLEFRRKYRLRMVQDEQNEISIL